MQVTSPTQFGIRILKAPQTDYHGLIVLRLRRQDKPYVLQIVARLVLFMKEHAPDKKLWIVEETRVRISDG